MADQIAGLSIENEGYGAMDETSPLIQLPSEPVLTSAATANYARLSMLVIDAGTEAAARRVKENLPEMQTLKQALKEKKEEMKGFLASGKLKPIQYKLLYPPGNLPVNEEAIDLTLWIFLMYNITANARKMKWSTNPRAKQKEYWHDIQRLKNIRNRLAHIPKAELSEEKFWDLWEETKMVLLRLDVSEDNIDGYLVRDLEPEKARQAVQEIKEQYLSDLGVLLDARRNENRKLKIILAVICILIVISVVVSISVALRIAKPWSSCAKHIKYANTGEVLLSYMTRDGWGASKPDYKHLDHLRTPVEYAIITHTAQVLLPCSTTDECCMTVKEIQKLHMTKAGWADIAFNYIVGGNAAVFIGRGPTYVGATAKGWNRKSISIAFIGDFIYHAPSDEVLNSLDGWLDYLTQTNVLTQNFTLYGLCQVRTLFPDSPGAAFLAEIERRFPGHWKNDSISDCNQKPLIA